MRQACQKKAPPEREAFNISEEMPERCPEGLVCYTEEEHEGVELALLKLKKVERWASITWKRCKPTSSEGETP